MKDDRLHTGRFLSKYYKNELNSFSTYLDIARAKQNKKNIHQLRVHIKRLKAFFKLLEMLFPKEFDAKENSTNFRTIFKSAGEIRKAQLNMAYAHKYKIAPSLYKQYAKALRREEKRSKNKFQKAVKKFDVKWLNQLKVKEMCSGVNGTKVEEICLLFMKQEVAGIKKLLAIGNEPVIMHKIRKHLKIIDVIGSIFYQINRDALLNKIMMNVKQCGESIGRLHDNVMLSRSLEGFFKKMDDLTGKEMISLIKILNKMAKENQILVKKDIKAIRLVLKAIENLESPFNSHINAGAKRLVASTLLRIE